MKDIGAPHAIQKSEPASSSARCFHLITIDYTDYVDYTDYSDYGLVLSIFSFNDSFFPTDYADYDLVLFPLLMQ